MFFADISVYGNVLIAGVGKNGDQVNIENVG